jgi:pimeloyl-ACP methyl ester carboxylesterase
VKDPATEARPLGRLTVIAEHFLRITTWGTQAASAVTCLVITAQPSAWQAMYAKEPFSVIMFLLFSMTMTFIWGASLWEETRRFYDRASQRLHRKAGLVGHGSVALIAAMAASQEPQRLGKWIALGAVVFTATTTWTVWMQAQLLPDDDQAVIDTIIARETAERIAAHQTVEREQRRRRLTAIVESLGYTLTEPAPPASKPAAPPAVKWTVPKDKHAPFVYFIRNGNRMKIGTTTDLKRRIRTLALREENIALLVNGDHRREREYHKQFAALRVGNTEWFAHEGALADYVQAQVSRISQKGQGK